MGLVFGNKCPLTPAPLPRGERGSALERACHCNGHARTPSPHPHSLANADIQSGKLAKASLPGEGWGEG